MTLISGEISAMLLLHRSRVADSVTNIIYQHLARNFSYFCQSVDGVVDSINLARLVNATLDSLQADGRVINKSTR